MTPTVAGSTSTSTSTITPEKAAHLEVAGGIEDDRPASPPAGVQQSDDHNHDAHYHRQAQLRLTEETRLGVAFWLMGLLNNTSFVIMIAGAKDISDGGTAMVFLSTVLPSLLVKLSAPLWFHRVSYGIRIASAAVLMVSSFCTVAYFSRRSGRDEAAAAAAADAGDDGSMSRRREMDVGFQLVGVMLGAFQCGLGEASLLALAGRYASPPSSALVVDDSAPKATYLTAFSSGTGLAGVFGFAWVAALHMWLGASFASTLMLANTLAILYAAVFFGMLGEGPDHHLHPHPVSPGGHSALPMLPVGGDYVGMGEGGDECGVLARTTTPDDVPECGGSPGSDRTELLGREGGERRTLNRPGAEGTSYNGVATTATAGAEGHGGDEDDFDGGDDDACCLSDGNSNPDLGDMDVDEMSPWQRGRLVASLWPYMIPLFVVYAAEYCLQSGTWTAIGFPVDDKVARDKFYEYSNWMYQIGVFLSRSSGNLYQASLRVLWLLPALQVANLIFFYLTAATHFWYNWGLLVPCFLAGCLGGGVYVNAFTRINVDLPPHHVEFALSSASVADSFGILLADMSGLFLQSCLYRANSVGGAVVSCPF